jgi:hypothetical protein
MADLLDYAALSAIAYNTARRGDNVLGHPDNWSQIDNASAGSSGFSAQAYRNGNDVVIAFAGTNFFSSYTDANGSKEQPCLKHSFN